MRIIIESGLIITLTSLISVITYVTGSNSIYATSDVVRLAHSFMAHSFTDYILLQLVQNIGIAFNLIVIRARSQPSDEYTLYSTITPSAPRFPIAMRNATSGTEDPSQGISLDDFDLNRGRGDPRKHIEIKVDHDHEGDHIRAIDSRNQLGNGKMGINTI
jgi:hypothetical protein